MLVTPAVVTVTYLVRTQKVLFTGSKIYRNQLNKYLLSIYYLPGTTLGSTDRCVNKNPYLPHMSEKQVVIQKMVSPSDKRKKGRETGNVLE